MTNIISIITQVCLFGNPTIPRQQKIDCMETLVNCSVGPGGLVTDKLLNACVDSLQKPERKK